MPFNPSQGTGFHRVAHYTYKLNPICTARPGQLLPFTHTLLLTPREAEESRSFYSTALQHFPPHLCLRTHFVLHPSKSTHLTVLYCRKPGFYCHKARFHIHKTIFYFHKPVFSFQRSQVCSWENTKASTIYLTLTLPWFWTNSVRADLKIRLWRASAICPDTTRAICIPVPLSGPQTSLRVPQTLLQHTAFLRLSQAPVRFALFPLYLFSHPQTRSRSPVSASHHRKESVGLPRGTYSKLCFPKEMTSFPKSRASRSTWEEGKGCTNCLNLCWSLPDTLTWIITPA